MFIKTINCFWGWVAALSFSLILILNPAGAANLLRNGGLETGSVSGWSPWPLSGLTNTILSDGNAREGTHYYRAQLDNTVNYALMIQDFGDLTDQGLAVGGTLRFSAWFKTGTNVNSGAVCDLRRCWGTNGVLDGATFQAQVSSTGQQTTWKQLSADFPLLGPPYNCLRIYLECQNITNGPATFYWDDAQMTYIQSDDVASPPIFTADYFNFENAINRPGKVCRVLAKLTYKGGTLDGPVSFQIGLPAGVQVVGGVDTRSLDRPLNFGESFFPTWDITADNAGPANITARMKFAGNDITTFSTTLNFDPPLTLPQSDYVPVPHPINTSADVCMYYFPGWPARARWAPPRYGDPQRKPLLGYYDENKPEVIDWQIKWYVENGIKCVLLDWYLQSGHEYYMHWINAYKKARYRDMLKIAVMWCNTSYTLQDWLAVNQLWIDDYFSMTSYYKINGKPAVFIWQPAVLRKDLGGSAKLKSAMDQTKALAAAAGYGGITYVALNDDSSASEVQLLANEGYTGYTNYNEFGSGGDFTNVVQTVPATWTSRNNYSSSLAYYPVITTGWDPRPWGYPGYYITGRTPKLFKQLLTSAKTFIQSHPKPLVVLGPDAEWGEGSYLQPCAQFGFGMLEQVRQVFCTDNPTSWPVNFAPGDVGLGPYDYPDPVSYPKWTFDTDPGGWGDYWCTKDIRAEQGQLRFHVTFNNPAICVDVPFIRASQYTKAIIQMKVAGPPGSTNMGQLYWSIRGANFPEDTSVRFPVKTDGVMHTYTLDLNTNPNWTSTINSLRFDPCDFLTEVDVSIEQFELVDPTRVWGYELYQ